ncbi:phosphatidylethanolamine N-methyltransferase [Piedraia hortae CBS 480.64]|uniref:Phosphatidylethanolamine N-methyltransferase n=1 Tax=Piedraia hortae CBS 480.64 TaxID=1314780 RepID=A0A6A7C371_9PEZI|nr:phosphatidylethanolamine N-methyltransferase [Piedraia hortae CBS 480.64]
MSNVAKSSSSSHNNMDVADPKGKPHTDTAELRERLLTREPAKAQNAQATVKKLNDENGQDSEGGHTFGRTPDGTIFTVPHTEDMVSQLFNPWQPKNISDAFIVGILVGLCCFYFLLPPGTRAPVFAVIFLFWRTCYNLGIGWLLYNQSQHNRLINWAKKYKILDRPQPKEHPRPYVYNFLKRDLESKIPKGYSFDKAPVEFNTWLLFRRVVDLVLMSDFTSYCLFALACVHQPAGESTPVTLLRWTGGVLLILFNLWVKLDAHRVVKDFAWYWGDFFFLIDQELTFDGVFELAPHPMYSVGYAGYYGISMLTASYKVLFVSIIAHTAQLLFLAVVENPHIERTYNTPSNETEQKQAGENTRPGTLYSGEDTRIVFNQRLGRQGGLYRTTNVSLVVLQVYLYIAAILSPSNRTWQAVFVLNAVIWRLWYSFGLGFILNRQSSNKWWTRQFVKHGESIEEAWRQWKDTYRFSLVMCYTGFACATWKMYGLPGDWTIGMAVLRHVLGVAFILLQLLTVLSIHDSLGEFGWYFGDFFFEGAPRLNYDGIYRYLNNPERTIGLAGVWGAAMITWSKTIFALALLSHSLTFCFVQFVERPHMQKLYRQGLREVSGVSRSIQRSLPSPIQKWTESGDRMLDECLDFVEAVIETKLSKVVAALGNFVTNSTSLVERLPARISITRLAPDLGGCDPKDYSLEIDQTQPGMSYKSTKPSGREGMSAQDGPMRLTLLYGSPIKVKWTAPRNHSKNDWIGLYRVGDNATREVTRVSSQGRWNPTNKGMYHQRGADNGVVAEDQPYPSKELLCGEVEFRGDKLWWTEGVFEFRYHHDGMHNVMDVSQPFSLHIDKFDEDGDATSVRAVEAVLLPMVQNCFDRDPVVAPQTVEETFGPTLEREGKYARRVVYAVKQMFGIEFAPDVVRADGCVRHLAWRIVNAKKVLAPYSMSPQRCSTPV